MLAISHQLAGMLGGQIGAESEEGAGATFWFTARFARQAGELLAQDEFLVETSSSLQDRRRKVRILLALEHVKTLQGVLPICMHCHKIRNDQESWERVDKYISEHSGAVFSHGLCPECLEKHYPE